MLKGAYLFALNAFGRTPVSPLAYRAGNSTVLFEAEPGSHDVVFHDNFLGSGLAAFETHGLPFGVLMNSRGQYRGAFEVALMEIAPRLQRINYPPGKEMLLLACEGGSSGAAQIVATALQRPVEGYKKSIYVYPPCFVQYARLINLHTQYNLPTEKIGLIKRLKGVKGPFGDRPNKDYAQSKTYYP